MNNTYTNNQALYGNDYASYPFKLKILSDAAASNLLVSGGEMT